MHPLIVVLLILLLLGGLPVWGYHNYGWYPSGGVGLILLIIIVLALLGRL